MPAPPTRLTFRPRHRLTHARQFQGVYRARVQRASGPLVVFARPNDVPHARLGLSVGARVGGAVKRNRIKRRLREAFRLGQLELPTRPVVGAEGEKDKSSKFKVQIKQGTRLGEAYDDAHASERRATGFDFVINVRPHEPLAVEEYGRLLRELAGQLAADWERKLGTDRDSQRRATRPEEGRS